MAFKKKKDPIVHLTSGAISGLSSCILLQPFDLVKTRLQQQRQQHSKLLVSPMNSTIADTVKEVIRKETVFGLWRGTVPTIIRNVPGSALYFLTLSEIRFLLSQRNQSKSTLKSSSSLPILSDKENLFAGMIARGSVGFVMMPITIVKVRYESNLYNYKSTWEALSSIIKNEGIKGMFYGSGITAIRDAPYAGLYVLFYERWKLSISANTSSISPPIIHMTSGNYLTFQNRLSVVHASMIAGLSATTVTHPFDMLKTRVQLKPLEYPNLWRASLKILREEGFLGYFDGLTLRLGRKSMQAAISWTMYETL
ncbi:14044_t:CDS:2, partial [Acaulospora morrowiae]